MFYTDFSLYIILYILKPASGRIIMYVSKNKILGKCFHIFPIFHMYIFHMNTHVWCVNVIMNEMECVMNYDVYVG